MDKTSVKISSLNGVGSVSEGSRASYWSRIRCYFYKGFSEEKIRQFVKLAGTNFVQSERERK